MLKPVLRRPARTEFFAPLTISSSSCAPVVNVVVLLLFLISSCPAAVLHGVLIDNKTGQPLAHSRVTIEGPGTAAGGNTAYTGAAGQFSFSGLPAGAWSVSAQKPGYATAKYGQPDWKSPGTPVILSSDDSFYAILRMRRLGVIAGEVLDENKLPLPGLAVLAYQLGTKLTVKGGSATDDRGAFRIAGLEPGRYVVSTRPFRLEDRTAYMPTFFGQTVRSQEARVVSVALEQEAGGVQILPMAGILSTLSGVVEGGPARVSLYMDIGRQESQLDASGQFRFDLVPPGQYELLAESSMPGEPRTAWQRVNVAKQAEFVTLELAPAPTVRIRCQEKDGKPFDGSAITLFARRQPPEENAQRLSCGESAAMTPGDWVVAVMPPTSVYVHSLRAGRIGKEVQVLELRPGQNAEIMVIVSAKPATLKGKVEVAAGQPAIGAPVYVNPLDPDLRARTGGLRSGRTDQDGKFVIGGLAPGRYEVLSTFSAVPEESSDWTAGRGKVVDVRENAECEVELLLQQPAP